ncbi:hypothetical protein FQN50_009347, partial [Emmonsiellopsis sp. PD_5]
MQENLAHENVMHENAIQKSVIQKGIIHDNVIEEDVVQGQHPHLNNDINNITAWLKDNDMSDIVK